MFSALKSNDFLRGIDVSNNGLASAKRTMVALCGEPATTTGSDGAFSDKEIGLLFNPSLTALRLAGNQLSQRAVAPLLAALASNVGRLRSVTTSMTHTYFTLNTHMYAGTWT